MKTATQKSRLAKAILFGIPTIVVMACASGTDDDGKSKADNNDTVEKIEEKTGKDLSAGQANAIEAAESYLDTAGFSRDGLLKQLKFEDYSAKDATFAVDHVDVNWNKEAEEAAESYMDTSSFSRDGLIKQLKFEGFTQAQAEHGADSVGL